MQERSSIKLSVNILEFLNQRILENEGLSCLKVKSVNTHSKEWQVIIEQIEYLPVRYGPEWIAYQLKYYTGIFDQSLIFFWDNLPAAIWPIATINENDGTISLSSSDKYVLPPLYTAQANQKSIKKINSLCCQFLSQVNANWKYAEMSIQNYPSDFYFNLLRIGSKTKVINSCYIDLGWSFSEIQRNIRKSYKSLITSGLKKIDVKIHRSDISDTIFDEFMEIHLQAAGRITRPLETWLTQKKSIQNNSAFLVTTTDKIAGKMLGAGYFYKSKDEAEYVVGAYDRDYSELPLGHVTQMKAIEEMKNQGIKWYHLGPRHFPGDTPPPSEKELNISLFKEGFATHLYPQFILSLN